MSSLSYDFAKFSRLIRVIKIYTDKVKNRYLKRLEEGFLDKFLFEFYKSLNKKKRFRISSESLLVGAEGVEPPTLCL